MQLQGEELIGLREMQLFEPRSRDACMPSQLLSTELKSAAASLLDIGLPQLHITLKALIDCVVVPFVTSTLRHDLH
jgi:hypothetical protein